MNAFLLAAGFGKRMGNLTESIPKPLLPVHGRPLIDYALFQLYLWNVNHVVVNTHYLGHKLEEHLKNFPHIPLTISRENDMILDRAGGIRTGLPYFPEQDSNLIVLNPDTIFIADELDQPFRIEDQTDESWDAFLFMKEKPSDSSETGFDLRDCGDTHSSVCHASLIPSGGDYFYIGYSIIHTNSLSHLQENEVADLIPIWKMSSEKRRLLGRRFSGKIIDAGTRDAYLKIKDTNPLPQELMDKWTHFIKGWESPFTSNRLI